MRGGAGLVQLSVDTDRFCSTFLEGWRFGCRTSARTREADILLLATTGNRHACSSFKRNWTHLKGMTGSLCLSKTMQFVMQKFQPALSGQATHPKSKIAGRGSTSEGLYYVDPKPYTVQAQIRSRQGLADGLMEVHDLFRVGGDELGAVQGC